MRNMLLTFPSYNLESREGSLSVIQTDVLLFHNSVSVSLHGKGKQRVKKGMRYIFYIYTVSVCVLHALGLLQVL